MLSSKRKFAIKSSSPNRFKSAFCRRLGAACPSNYNPADFFVQVLAVVPGRELTCRHAIETTCDAFQKSVHGAHLAQEAEAVHGEFENSLKRFKYPKNSDRSLYKANWCEQFRAVLWRSWLTVIREPILVKVRLLQTIVRFPPLFIYLHAYTYAHN